MARDPDESMEVEQFLRMLSQIEKYEDRRFNGYGIEPTQIADIRRAAVEFTEAAQSGWQNPVSLPDHIADVHVRAHSRESAPVRHYWRRKPATR